MPRLQRAGVYKVLYSRTPLLSAALEVLQMTLLEHKNVTATITRRVVHMGLHTESWTTLRNGIDRIVADLLTFEMHEEVSNRALLKGEPEADVHFAIRRIVYLVHKRLRKRRASRASRAQESRADHVDRYEMGDSDETGDQDEMEDRDGTDNQSAETAYQPSKNSNLPSITVVRGGNPTSPTSQLPTAPARGLPAGNFAAISAEFRAQATLRSRATQTGAQNRDTEIAPAATPSLTVQCAEPPNDIDENIFSLTPVSVNELAKRAAEGSSSLWRPITVGGRVAQTKTIGLF